MLDLTDTVQVLAGTVYGEARGLGVLGMADVAHVIRNRVHLGYGKTIPSCCLARWQFSCWNENDLNRAKIMRAAQDDPHGWALAVKAAQGVLAGDLPDRTLGADSYFAVSMQRPPFWATPPARHTVTLGAHSFWIVTHALARNISVHQAASDSSADALNAAELARIITPVGK